MKKLPMMIGAAVFCANAAMADCAAKSPCREIRFEPLPMKFGDTAQRGTPHSKDPTVIRHNGRYLMYYSVRNCDKAHLRAGDDPIRLKSWWGAVAESTNLVDWTRIDDIRIDGVKFVSAAVAPFFKPELPWEMHCIEAPTVVEHGGIWYMFYAGAYNHERQQIGAAWSADGVKFTRYRGEPVFPHGEKGSWNEWESGHPGFFVDDDGQCYLFFQGKATLWGDYSLSCAKVKFVD